MSKTNMSPMATIVNGFFAAGSKSPMQSAFEKAFHKNHGLFEDANTEIEGRSEDDAE